MRYNRGQFRREYCSCLPITESKSSNLLLRVLMFSSSSFISRPFFRLSCSYSWSFSIIKLIASCRSMSCAVPLIWFSCVVCAMSLRIFSGTDESFKRSSHYLLHDSPFSFELLVKSLFSLLKTFVISRLILNSITTIPT